MYESMRTSNPKVVTGIYYIAWIFIGNFVLLNLLLSIIFDAFVTEDEIDNNEEDLEAQQEAEKKKKIMMQKEKERRLKKMGQTIAGSKANMLGLTGQKGLPPSKKNQKTFTAANRIPANLEQLIDEIEDLSAEDIKKHLVGAKVIKKKDKHWYIRPIDEVV